jgi:hypothetical protein
MAAMVAVAARVIVVDAAAAVAATATVVVAMAVAMVVATVVVAAAAAIAMVAMAATVAAAAGTLCQLRLQVLKPLRLLPLRLRPLRTAIALRSLSRRLASADSYRSLAEELIPVS